MENVQRVQSVVESLIEKKTDDIKNNVYLDTVLETIEQCKTSYVPPIKTYINCSDFGKLDGMNGSCQFCAEMTPYLFEMCSDESCINSYLRQGKYFNGKVKTREDAIKTIHSHKSKSLFEDIVVYGTHDEIELKR